MKAITKKISVLLVLLLSVAVLAIPAAAAGETDALTEETTAVTSQEAEQENVTGQKALSAALAIGLAAAAGALGMGLAISKSAESIARQPEAEGKIRTSLMLGLVFVETAIIYALIIAILIIFVL